MIIPFTTRLPGTLADLQPIPGVTILGIGHKARQGKDRAALIMHARVPMTSRILSFADALKGVATGCYGMTKKDGALLQELGVSMRDMDPDHWVKALYWRIKELRPALVIIPDVRFKNETAWVRQMGGSLLRIQRYNPDGSRFIDPSRPATHISETDLDDYTGWNWTLDNRKSDWEFEGTVNHWYNIHASSFHRRAAAA